MSPPHQAPDHPHLCMSRSIKSVQLGFACYKRQSVEDRRVNIQACRSAAHPKVLSECGQPAGAEPNPTTSRPLGFTNTHSLIQAFLPTKLEHRRYSVRSPRLKQCSPHASRTNSTPTANCSSSKLQAARSRGFAVEKRNAQQNILPSSNQSNDYYRYSWI